MVTAPKERGDFSERLENVLDRRWPIVLGGALAGCEKVLAGLLLGFAIMFLFEVFRYGRNWGRS